jgi:hypothetical protein
MVSQPIGNRSRFQPRFCIQFAEFGELHLWRGENPADQVAATDGVGAEVGSGYSRNLFLAAATIRSAAPSIPSVSVFTLKS